MLRTSSTKVWQAASLCQPHIPDQLVVLHSEIFADTSKRHNPPPGRLGTYECEDGLDLRRYAFDRDFYFSYTKIEAILYSDSPEWRRETLLQLAFKRQDYLHTCLSHFAAPFSPINRWVLAAVIAICKPQSRAELLAIIYPQLKTFLKPDDTEKMSEAKDTASSLDLSSCAIAGSSYCDVNDFQELSTETHFTLFRSLTAEMQEAIYARNTSLEHLRERMLACMRKLPSPQKRAHDLLERMEHAHIRNEPVIGSLRIYEDLARLDVQITSTCIMAIRRTLLEQVFSTKKPKASLENLCEARRITVYTGFQASRFVPYSLIQEDLHKTPNYAAAIFAFLHPNTYDKLIQNSTLVDIQPSSLAAVVSRWQILAYFEAVANTELHEGKIARLLASCASDPVGVWFEIALSTLWKKLDTGTLADLLSLVTWSAGPAQIAMKYLGKRQTQFRTKLLEHDKSSPVYLAAFVQDARNQGRPESDIAEHLLSTWTPPSEPAMTEPFARQMGKALYSLVGVSGLQRLFDKDPTLTENPKKILALNNTSLSAHPQLAAFVGSNAPKMQLQDLICSHLKAHPELLHWLLHTQSAWNTMPFDDLASTIARHLKFLGFQRKFAFEILMQEQLVYQCGKNFNPGFMNWLGMLRITKSQWVKLLIQEVAGNNFFGELAKNYKWPRLAHTCKMLREQGFSDSELDNLLKTYAPSLIKRGCV